MSDKKSAPWSEGTFRECVAMPEWIAFSRAVDTARDSARDIAWSSNAPAAALDPRLVAMSLDDAMCAILERMMPSVAENNACTLDETDGATIAKTHRALLLSCPTPPRPR